MSFARSVQPELLDSLAADDPRAVRSRRDLRRVNRLMGAASLLSTPLAAALKHAPGSPVVEIGAGDGTLLLRIARRLKVAGPVDAKLLDLQPVVASATTAAYREAGWAVEVLQADVLDWLARPAPADAPRPIILANLFLHHFEGERLRALLGGLAQRADAVVCVEPRRSATALFASRLLGAIGCNDVTRHDAVVSVRAGFAGRELTALWPRVKAWRLDEGPAGLFGHRFVALRDRTHR